MLEILDLGRTDLLAYRVSDVLSEEDVQHVTAAFDALLENHDTVHLYAEVEGVRGFEARALWLDVVYGLRRLGALRHIGRVALVTDAAWIRRLARLEARLLPIGRLNVYRPDVRDDARAWILGDAGAPASTAETLGDYDAWIEREDLALTWADAVWHDGSGGASGTDSETARSNGDTAPTPPAPRFGHTVHRTHVLLRRVADELGTVGTAPAYHALRAVLHALRDRIPAAEAADLAAQLTTIVRGVFYEGYHPARMADKVGRQGFLDDVASELHPGAPFGSDAAVRAVGRALTDTVSLGEWNQVLGTLPQDVRSLFEAPVSS